MTKFAVLVSIAFSAGVATLPAAFAADSHVNTAPGKAGSAPTAATPATPSTAAAAQSGAPSAAQATDAESKKKKHDKKVSHKHRKKDENTDGDGEPIGQIGRHKNVDGGFDFENSKKFHRMGN